MTFAQAVSVDMLQIEPFSKITTLHLALFHPDKESCRLLVQMPNLKSLTLTGLFMDALMYDWLVLLLTSGRARTNLTALSICGITVAWRHLLQRLLGVCVLTDTEDGI